MSVQTSVPPTVSDAQQQSAFPANSYAPQAPGAQPSAYYQPVAPQSNGKVIGALVCGILSILFAALPLIGIILGIVAIVLAVQAVKQVGKDSKATGAKVCGIVGIVLSVLSFFVWIALGMGFAYVIDAAQNDDPVVSPSVSSEVLPSATEEDQQLEAAAAAKLDLLATKDAALVQQLADEVDSTLSSAAGYSLTDLGIEPASFIEWVLADFDYELEGTYDNGDGTGTVYASLTLRDSMAFASTFTEDVQAAIDAGQVQNLDEAGAKALLGELYRGAMDKTTSTTTDYVSLDLIQTGDSWQVDEDSWKTELDYLFGL